jgi:hypothetical protein
VHRVREESDTDRGVRAGVLKTLAVLAAVAIVSCGQNDGKPQGAARAAADPRAAWYQLQSGSFQRIGGIGEAVRTPLRPWTVQARVTDEAFAGDTLYCAVNGYGIAAWDPGSQQPAFHYFYDTLIFPYRTLTAIVPRRGEITAHLYFNQMLNTVKPADLTLRGFNLVSLVPSASDFKFIIPPYQEGNPEWEAVGFMPVSDEEFLLEWKLSGGSETRFAYTRYQPGVGRESPISREAYIGAFKLSTGSGVSESEASLFRASRDSLSGVSSDAAVHFSIRSRESPVRKIFRSGEGITTLVVIPIFEEGAQSYALLPGGKVLHRAGDGSVKTVTLPPLPSGYRYTDLVKFGGLLLLPWEEARFTDVGPAGVLVYTLG